MSFIVILCDVVIRRRFPIQPTFFLYYKKAGKFQNKSINTLIKLNFMTHQIHPNRIRQVLFLAALILLGLLIAKEMFFMLGSFLGAITLYVLMRNLMLKLILDFPEVVAQQTKIGLHYFQILIAGFLSFSFTRQQRRKPQS